MLKTGFFILIIFHYSLCQAQEDSIAKLPSHHYNLKLTYISSLIYPGVSTGIEFPLQNSKWQGSGKQTLHKSVSKNRLIAADLNWYHHPAFHDNIYLSVEWIMRRIKSGGFVSEFSAGSGYSRTFLAGTTYRVNDNGSISIVKLAGYSYALITVGGGFGYDFSVNKQLPFSTLAKINLITMFPFNSTLYLRPVLEIGIRYRPALLFNKIIRKKFSSISK